MCVCFLWWHITPVLKNRSWWCLIFFYNYGEYIMSKPCEKVRWKVLGSSINIARLRIQNSSITTNVRLQQVTFTCFLKNNKMLPGYHPVFSLVSQSYKSLRIILFFPRIFIVKHETCGIPLSTYNNNSSSSLTMKVATRIAPFELWLLS